MKKVKRAGTIVLCAIMAFGLLLVLCISISTGLRKRGISNHFTVFFTKNVSITATLSELWEGDRGKYAKKQNLPEKIESFSSGFRSIVESYSTGSIPGNRYLKSVSDFFQQKILHCSVAAVPGGKTNQEYAEEAFLEVRKFSQDMAAQGIDFVFVQLPFGDRFRAMEGEAGHESQLDLWDRFASLMRDSDIPFYNLCDEDTFLESVSLDASDHWFPGDALKATALIASACNKMYGSGFDLSIFEPEQYRNILDDYPDFATDIRQEFGYDYILPVPIDKSFFSILINDEAIFEGNFTETQLTSPSSWIVRADNEGFASYHNMWRWNNGSYLETHNRNTSVQQAGYKVLLLGDSFCWPVSAYLSQSTEYLTSIHPRYFDGDIRTYINCYQPDLIIWAYVEAQVGSFNQQTFTVVN